MWCVRARRQRRTIRRTSSGLCISRFVSFSYMGGSSRVDRISLSPLVRWSRSDLILSLYEVRPYRTSSSRSLDTNTAHRSKGLTELGIARLGYADTIVFRPSLFRGGERQDRRIVESILGCVACLSCLVYHTHALSFIVASSQASPRISVQASKSRCVLPSCFLSLPAHTPHTGPPPRQIHSQSRRPWVITHPRRCWRDQGRCWPRHVVYALVEQGGFVVGWQVTVSSTLNRRIITTNNSVRHTYVHIHHSTSCTFPSSRFPFISFHLRLNPYCIES